MRLERRGFSISVPRLPSGKIYVIPLSVGMTFCPVFPLAFLFFFACWVGRQLVPPARFFVSLCAQGPQLKGQTSDKNFQFT